MKILIVSGFLGAGKTTFIKKLVQMTTGFSIAVLENDYGMASIDKDFIENEIQSDKADLEVWEMLEGCICCSKKADFATSVLTISNTIDPEHLIVEPTGIGRLSSVIKNIGMVEYERITLLRPVTLIDVTCFSADMVRYGDIYKDQVLNTGRIVFTKTENIPHFEKEYIKSQLHEMGANAEIEIDHYACNDRNWWCRLLSEQQEVSRLISVTTGTQESDFELSSRSFHDVNFISVGDLVRFLEKTVVGGYGDIRRAKGCVLIGNEDVRFDIVDKRYTIYGVSGINVHDVVLIGKEMKLLELIAVLDEF